MCNSLRILYTSMLPHKQLLKSRVFFDFHHIIFQRVQQIYKPYLLITMNICQFQDV